MSERLDELKLKYMSELDHENGLCNDVVVQQTATAAYQLAKSEYEAIPLSPKVFGKVKDLEEEIKHLKEQNEGFQKQYNDSGELVNSLRDANARIKESWNNARQVILDKDREIEKLKAQNLALTQENEGYLKGLTAKQYVKDIEMGMGRLVKENARLKAQVKLEPLDYNKVLKIVLDEYQGKHKDLYDISQEICATFGTPSRDEMVEKIKEVLKSFTVNEQGDMRWIDYQKDEVATAIVDKLMEG